MKKSLWVLFWLFTAASIVCSILTLAYDPMIAGTIIFGAVAAKIGYTISVSDL